MQMKADGTVACTVHVVLLNVQATVRRLLIAQGYAIPGFLSVGTEGENATNRRDRTSENEIEGIYDGGLVVDICDFVAPNSV